MGHLHERARPVKKKDSSLGWANTSPSACSPAPGWDAVQRHTGGEVGRAARRQAGRTQRGGSPGAQGTPRRPSDEPRVHAPCRFARRSAHCPLGAVTRSLAAAGHRAARPAAGMRCGGGLCKLRLPGKARIHAIQN